MRYTTALLLGCILFFSGTAQRIYRSNSVLASGEWYKISVKEAGVYRVSISLLQSLGVNVSNLQSSSIRLYGNGGQMLPEQNAIVPLDDLTENAIQIVDGGDGVLSGSDYFLFYSNGPQQWIKDSANKRFRHQKNLYSNEAFWYDYEEGHDTDEWIPVFIPKNAFSFSSTQHDHIRHFHPRPFHLSLPRGMMA